MLKVINNLNGYTCANVKEREEKKVRHKNKLTCKTRADTSQSMRLSKQSIMEIRLCVKT